MIYRVAVLSAVFLTGMGSKGPAQAGVSNIEVVNGTCSSSSNTAEGPLSSDLTKRQSQFFCDSALITFFDDYPGHVLIDFSQKESHDSPVLGFAGQIETRQPGDVGTMMQVNTVYLGPREKATTVSEGSCELFFANQQLSGIGCGMKVDETGRRTVAIVVFNVAPGQHPMVSIAPSQSQPVEHETQLDPPNQFRTYTNERFGFSIDYPPSFVPKEPPQNGDGMALESPDGTAILVVSGSNSSGVALSAYYDTAVRTVKGELGYHTASKDWFVVTWKEGDRLTYQKTFVGSGSENSFTFSYPEGQKLEYDHMVTRIEKSFRHGDLGHTW
jgi:hypothetical protein